MLAPKVTQVLGDANAVRVGGLIVVTVMTLDDLSNVELWIEEEEVLGLGSDETKSNGTGATLSS